ncbi:hypothetical protein [Bacterioplanoides sp. SCSIO 12839]|uniref:hypothetical protein n=1 Tax=Bacterioplanoides sp. SCSIO 12839 TaxID=2829569 RepID=UPI002106DD41|nr:hypothetical protein [Bacterioplanoides sp. SCSIO 12839]UTW47719.1 hypothetical protein KFF03_14270 [Bacterioplanoides sp. SCSIO 12839]
MDSKIKIKMGPIEIEYEGSEAFLKEELPALLSAVSDLYKESGVTEAPTAQEPVAAPVQNSSVDASSSALQATTGSIAAQLGVKSGPDLILAAAARMTFSLGMDTFSRSQITEEMKTASAYFKKTHVNNLTKYLNQLVKDQKLLETSKNTYALSASAKSSIGARIAQ